MKRRIFAMLLTCFILVCAMSITAMAADTKGSCGDNVTWSFDASTGTLTISGTGEMWNYQYDSKKESYYTWDTSPTIFGRPWDAYEEQVKTVVVENGVTSIGDRAFSGLEYLKTAEIADTVQVIGISVFSNTDLETVTLPKEMKSIANYAFHNTDITSITVPKGITEIALGTFEECKQLETVVLPDTLASIAYHAFASCESLKTIDLPNSLNSIGERAFVCCFDLEKIEIPGSVSVVEEQAFYGALGVKEIIFHEGVQRIKKEAFASCDSLRTVTIPVSLTRFDDEAFNGWSKSVKVLYEGNCKQWGEIDFGYGNDILANAKTDDFHVYEIFPEVPSTCTESGMKQKEVCTLCEFTRGGEIINPKNHWSIDVLNKKDVTCEEDGYTGDSQCEFCGIMVEQGEVIPALGHDPELKNKKQESCEEDGYTGDEICKTCDKTLKQGEIIEAWGHNPELKNAKEAVCEKDGYTGDEVCKKCGKTVKKGEVIPALSHNFTGQNKKDATCEEDGYTGDEICTNCGIYTWVGDVIPAHGHRASVKNEKAADCETDGYTGDEVCDFCEKVMEKGEAIPALGHKYADGECTVCGGEDPEYVTNPFNDVWSSDWYYNPVLWAVKKGVTGGKTADTFAPNESCTRAQVVTFIWAANGKPAPKSSVNPFDDVSKDDWYYKAVLWAVENGITGGIAEGLFGPNQVCTRAQVVTFLWAAKNKAQPDLSADPFDDVAQEAWYRQPVLWAVENNVTGGIGVRQFGPEQVCTRAQVVTFLYKVYG